MLQIIPDLLVSMMDSFATRSYALMVCLSERGKGADLTQTSYERPSQFDMCHDAGALPARQAQYAIIPKGWGEVPTIFGTHIEVVASQPVRVHPFSRLCG